MPGAGRTVAGAHTNDTRTIQTVDNHDGYEIESDETGDYAYEELRTLRGHGSMDSGDGSDDEDVVVEVFRKGGDKSNDTLKHSVQANC